MIGLAKEFELEPGERVLAQARKHWLLFSMELLPYAILAALPLAVPRVIAFVPQLAPYARIPHWPYVLGIWLLIVWTSAWGAFTRYYLNVWIVTDRRIVEVTQHRFFDREVSSVLLNRVQDVTTEVAGVLSSFLAIGTITVQSAGAVDEFHMHGIARPEAMRDLILERAGRESTGTSI